MSFPALANAFPDCVLEQVRIDPDQLRIQLRSRHDSACCPDCGRPSSRVHSHTRRQVQDLPLLGIPVYLDVLVRRFFCDTPTCAKRTFVEHLSAVTPSRVRRTPRVTDAVRVIGFAVGGEAGARVAGRLGVRTSGDTVLRILRATPAPNRPLPTVIGIDDFALCRGRSYGTILVDLDRHCPLDLLPDRTAETVAARLQESHTVTVVARDRSREFARGVDAGLPQATQVADRFHLLCSLREAIERTLHRLRPELRQLLEDDDATDGGSTPCDGPPPPQYDPGPARERIQAVKHAERDRRFQAVKNAQRRGLNLRQIAREGELSVATVRRWVQADRLPPERRGYRRGSKVEPYAAYLRQRLAEGCTNQSQLWREIRDQGFTGTRSLVAKWLRAHRTDDEQPARPPRRRLPSPKQLAWLTLQVDDPERSVGERSLWKCLGRHPELRALQQLATRFMTMVRERQGTCLDCWLADCRSGSIPELRNFAKALEIDRDAVTAALTLSWSNGPVEGQVTKLKLLKRGAYGRMKLDLLRQRLLHAA